jgi:hypothetical protein
MHLGLDIPHEGYNLFVLGETGSGRHAIIHQLLEAERRHGTPPADWCYVNDFSQPPGPSCCACPAVGARGCGTTCSISSKS